MRRVRKGGRCEKNKNGGNNCCPVADCRVYSMTPQQVARQQAKAYYNRPYEKLTADEKMRLEDHLARQSNTAWQTNAQVATGVGRLLQGIGVLILSAR